MHRDRMCLDRDAPLPFQIHVIEELLLHVSCSDGVGELQQAVGDRGLPMIDMRNDRKVADIFYIYICTYEYIYVSFATVSERKAIAAKMTRTSTELPRLEPESSASTNSAMAAYRTAIICSVPY